MSTESQDNFGFILEEHIRRIVKETAKQLLGQGQQHAPPSIKGDEAGSFQVDLQRIMAKEFISIKEAHLLLGCSDGHLRNLVDKAQKKKTSHPIPFLDLDGVTVFPRVKLLEWAERPKRGPKPAN
ncbi:MAG: helix-turn-helix domain-containing protein [Actinobacteria bacterium]|jgi:hypothetical protein|nr:helix-turn-helix domain-containing protein [Actinomycetota bacterium]